MRKLAVLGALVASIFLASAPQAMAWHVDVGCHARGYDARGQYVVLSYTGHHLGSGVLVKKGTNTNRLKNYFIPASNITDASQQPEWFMDGNHTFKVYFNGQPTYWVVQVQDMHQPAKVWFNHESGNCKQAPDTCTDGHQDDADKCKPRCPEGKMPVKEHGKWKCKPTPTATPTPTTTPTPTPTPPVATPPPAPPVATPTPTPPPPTPQVKECKPKKVTITETVVVMNLDPPGSFRPVASSASSGSSKGACGYTSKKQLKRCMVLKHSPAMAPRDPNGKIRFVVRDRCKDAKLLRVKWHIGLRDSKKCTSWHYAGTTKRSRTWRSRYFTPPGTYMLGKKCLKATKRLKVSPRNKT